MRVSLKTFTPPLLRRGKPRLPSAAVSAINVGEFVLCANPRRWRGFWAVPACVRFETGVLSSPATPSRLWSPGFTRFFAGLSGCLLNVADSPHLVFVAASPNAEGSYSMWTRRPRMIELPIVARTRRKPRSSATPHIRRIFDRAPPEPPDQRLFVAHGGQNGHVQYLFRCGGLIWKVSMPRVSRKKLQRRRPFDHYLPPVFTAFRLNGATSSATSRLFGGL